MAMSIEAPPHIAAIFLAREKRTEDWKEYLRSKGVRLAHPDDAWINRAKKMINPVYPDVYRDPDVGALAVIGSVNRWRFVEIRGVTFDNWYQGNDEQINERFHFVEIGPSCRYTFNPEGKLYIDVWNDVLN